MKSFFKFRQNNSGGSFTGPAVNVLVEAGTKPEAIARTEPHFTICGDSGLYAEYDYCGCCPCCGHRWSEPWGDEPIGLEELDGILKQEEIHYMRGVRLALVKEDGSLLIGDNATKLQAIKDYIAS